MSCRMQQKKVRGRPPILEWLFPVKIRETKCPKCGSPYLEHPDREPTHRFVSQNIELMLYATYRFGGRYFSVRVGAWRNSPNGFYLAQLMEQHELIELLSVVREAMEFIAEKNKVVRKSNTAME